MVIKRGLGFIPGVPTPTPISLETKVPIADIVRMIDDTMTEIQDTLTMCDQLKAHVGHIGWRVDQIKRILQKYR